jgi:Protein of unknown function (DUF3800)
MSIYRMYVDEVGNSDYKASASHRFLSLTGIIMEASYVANSFGPALEALKGQYFGTHPDDRVVLHRREMLQRVEPFEALKDPTTREAFNRDLLDLIRQTAFLLATVVIDKVAMVEQYRVWRQDPYHYCMQVLLERYVGELQGRGATGDVVAEARGKAEDKRLKRAYRRIYEGGTNFVKADDFASVLKSRQLHFKTKGHNIPGLQLADLIAYPSYRAVLAARRNQRMPDDFNSRMVGAFRDKYRRGANGQVWGRGQKWLP